MIFNQLILCNLESCFQDDDQDDDDDDDYDEMSFMDDVKNDPDNNFLDDYLAELDHLPKPKELDLLVELALRFCDSSAKAAVFLNTAMMIAKRPDLMLSKSGFYKRRNGMLSEAVSKRKSEDVGIFSLKFDGASKETNVYKDQIQRRHHITVIKEPPGIVIQKMEFQCNTTGSVIQGRINFKSPIKI